MATDNGGAPARAQGVADEGRLENAQIWAACD
jgi:hypothetical protein